jgi:membrane protein implicated in regulation of membrane protease activity
MDLFMSLSAVHWFALGLILLAAEALGAAGFLIGAAVAALANGVIVWLFPGLSPGVQLIVFAVGAIVATYVYFQMFRDAQRHDDTPPINERAASLIGHQFELAADVTHGEGRVQIGDTFWKVASDEDLSAGTLVEVEDADNMTLRLRHPAS